MVVLGWMCPRAQQEPPAVDWEQAPDPAQVEVGRRWLFLNDLLAARAALCRLLPRLVPGVWRT